MHQSCLNGLKQPTVVSSYCFLTDPEGLYGEARSKRSRIEADQHWAVDRSGRLKTAIDPVRLSCIDVLASIEIEPFRKERLPMKIKITIRNNKVLHVAENEVSAGGYRKGCHSRPV